MFSVKLLRGPDGFCEAAEAARLSHADKKRTRSDKELLKVLSKRGDDHAKALRGVVYWLEINAPRYWWQEYVTYTIGNFQLGSESTMHSRLDLTEEELVQSKSLLMEGTLQRRIFMVSYQTLQRMYRARKNHRLPEWREFCSFIEQEIFKLLED